MALTTDYIVLTAHEHEVTLTEDYYEENRPEIITWLVDNFGYDEDSGLWDLWEYNSHVYLTFVHQEDAMAFKLTWCG